MNPVPEMIIQTRALSKTYHKVEALKPLNLKVPKNSIFGFLGPNGAGKTTTMKLLLGLIRPSSGSGLIFGKDIVKEGVAIRERIGYLPQHPRFIEHMTARENLTFTARFFFQDTPAKIAGRVDEMIELVGLKEKADRPVRGFSGGEKQRLGIALAQINAPDLLILDEPASALDPIGRHEVLKIMERLRENTTIFYSTHILDDVQRVSDTVAILNRGELMAQGPIEQLLKGNDETIYTLDLFGVEEKHMDLIRAQPWVSQLNVIASNGKVTWQISVNDEETAKAHLLRLLLQDNQVIIHAYNRKTFELEEIFMNIIKGEENVH